MSRDNNILIYDIKRKLLAKYPRFGSEIAIASIEFRDDLSIPTAATDGEKIYIDSNYFESLTENDKLFTIAHEIMHIKFMHMYRLKDKNGNKRNLELWNIATDAIINANLERDGFTIKKEFVNMPEALNYSAEEFYQKLLQEKEQNEESKNDRSNSGDIIENDENKNTTNGNSKGDDHSLWEEAFEKHEKENEINKNFKNKIKESKPKTEEKVQNNFDEINEFKSNRQEKIERFMSRKEKIKKDIRSNLNEEQIKLGNIGKSKETIDWKKLIRREIEKSETIWSKRRAILENNYAYRLEEYNVEDEAETEVMIDISGSVNLNLVRAFLRQIKPLIKQSKLKVGCFNEKFWGLKEIKSIKDIDNFVIPEKVREHYSWTEDWDLAVRSFSKKRSVNKIVFTDGYPCPRKYA